MIWWSLVNVVATITLLILFWAGWWFLRRCWRVIKIYSVGYTWCRVKTLKGTTAEGWISVIQLKSVAGHIYQECPVVRVYTKTEQVTVNPGEFESIHEVLGLWKVALRGGSVGIAISS